MKRVLQVLALTMALVLFSSCGAIGALAGLGAGTPTTHEGKPGDRMKAYFFDFTVAGARAVDSYAGYIPSEGMRFIEVQITTTNTFGETLPMYDTDYELRWGTRNAMQDYAITLDAMDEQGAPREYMLADKESMTYFYVYEAPVDISSFELFHQEEMENADGDQITGDSFYIGFTV